MSESARPKEEAQALGGLLRQIGRTRYGGVPEAAKANAAFREAVSSGQPTHVCLGHALAFMEAVNDAVSKGVEDANEQRSELLKLQGDVKAMRRVLGL